MDEEDVSFGLTVYPKGAGVIRQVGIGIGTPSILIEFDVDESGVFIKTTTSAENFEDANELGEVLAYVAEAFQSEEFAAAYKAQLEAADVV